MLRRKSPQLVSEIDRVDQVLRLRLRDLYRFAQASQAFLRVVALRAANPRESRLPDRCRRSARVPDLATGVSACLSARSLSQPLQHRRRGEVRRAQEYAHQGNEITRA